MLAFGDASHPHYSPTLFADTSQRRLTISDFPNDPNQFLDESNIRSAVVLTQPHLARSTHQDNRKFDPSLRKLDSPLKSLPRFMVIFLLKSPLLYHVIDNVDSTILFDCREMIIIHNRD